MLAELAACNAAFSTVKSFLQNGRSLADCASQIGTIVASKSALEEKVQKKRSGFMAQLKNTQAQDLEEFLALRENQRDRRTINTGDDLPRSRRSKGRLDELSGRSEAQKKRRASTCGERKTRDDRSGHDCRYCDYGHSSSRSRSLLLHDTVKESKC